MRILMDGVEWKPREGSVPVGHAALLETLKVEALAQGRVLLQLSVDGSEIDEEGFRTLQGGLELRCTTCPVRDLVRDSLRQARDFFPALLRGVEGIADRLEQGKTQEALQLLQQATEGIGWILHVLQNCRLLLGMTQEDQESGTIQTDCIRLQGLLENISESLEQERFFELAFRLREELLPLLRRLERYAEQYLTTAEEGVQ